MMCDFQFPFSSLSNLDLNNLFNTFTTNPVDYRNLPNQISHDDFVYDDNDDIINDIDPDRNSNLFDICNKYWLPNDFNANSEFQHGDMFNLLHFNSRSLYKNFDSIHDFICQLDQNFSVYGFSETWIHSNTPVSLFNLSGYTFFHNDRENVEAVVLQCLCKIL